jgi:peptidoglycan/xylan/chitin deacetylase (PgdA/CDA1 family)
MKIGALAALALTFSLGACAPKPQADANSTPPPPAVREIAFTFDDAPMPDSQYMTGPARTERLIAALARADVNGAMIFSVGDPASSEQGRARLAAYAAAGHVIANHSNTHRSANRMSAEEFLADVGQADVTLRPMPGFRPFFRFPYLDAGETNEKRDALRTGLTRMGYAHGYVTVDTWDWHMAGEVDAALAQGRDVDWDAVGEVYVDVLVRSAEFYDSAARRWLGRSPRHVMLLHENDLAALFIDDAAAALRARGWRIVSAERAFADPISRSAPDTLYLNGGQVIAMAHIAGAPQSELNSGLTNAAALDALLAPALGPE